MCFTTKKLGMIVNARRKMINFAADLVTRHASCARESGARPELFLQLLPRKTESAYMSLTHHRVGKAPPLGKPEYLPHPIK